MTNNPIIVAIDTLDIKQARKLASDLQPEVGMIKLGLEFFIAHGPTGVMEVTNAGSVPYFLDLKLYDIPNTVAGGVRAACELGASMFTIHTSGGSEMMKAAQSQVKQYEDRSGKKGPLLLGVSVLTSMDQTTLDETGIGANSNEQVLHLADLAVRSGLSGLVCSSLEVRGLKEKFGDALKLVVPGIRPEGADAGDQKRVMTPSKALEQGADYLVIGRPITQSGNPVGSAKAIRQSI